MKAQKKFKKYSRWENGYLKLFISLQRRDPFGRYLTERSGYLRFTAFGRSHLYCAGQATWAPQYVHNYGRAICR